MEPDDDEAFLYGEGEQEAGTPAGKHQGVPLPAVTRLDVHLSLAHPLTHLLIGHTAGEL